MKQYNNERPLISIHIPKSGGTSFTDVLKKWFGRNLYLHYFDEKNNRMPRRYDLRYGILNKRFKIGVCIHGHFNKKRKIGVMDYYPEVDQFIMILRDPFEMVISNYFFVKRKGENSFRNGMPSKIKDQFQSIKEYIKDRKSYLLNFMPDEIDMGNYKEILEKDFIYIGIVEDLQTSVNVLAKRLGFPAVKITRLNVSARDEKVSEDLKKEFMDNHRLEYAIYNYALENYNK